MSDIFWYLILGFIIVDIIILFFVFTKKRVVFTDNDRRFFIEKWNKSLKLEKKEGIMEIDKIFNLYLNKRFGKGSVGDILKAKRAYFKSIDEVWFAHKIRNKIAHEIGVNIADNDYKKAIDGFRNGFKELGILK